MNRHPRRRPRLPAWVPASGESKAPAVRLALAADSRATQVPAAGHRTLFLLDRAAARLSLGLERPASP